MPEAGTEETTRMVSYSPPTEVERIVAVLAYIASKSTDKGSHSILKTLYGAEKVHLQEYARHILNGSYVAMEYGPVHSQLLDLLRHLQRPHPQFALSSELVAWAREHLEMPSQELQVKAEVDFEVLSESEIAALDAAIVQLQGMSFTDRTAWSHDSAWDRAVERAPDSRNAPMEWDDIVDTLPNGDVIKEHLKDPSPG